MITSKYIGYAASVPGSGHIRFDIPCQDASQVILSPRPAAIVCDGRGSAKLSHFGASNAVKAFRNQLAVLEPLLASVLDVDQNDDEQWCKFCRIMYRTLLQVKLDLAEVHSVAEKEFDFTVAFAIAGEKYIGCFQVGDGAIVLRQNTESITAFQPEKGEFANQTHFLRQGGEIKTAFQYKLFHAADNAGIAVTSDGPEHIMFKLPEMSPGKIFDAMFKDLAAEHLCRQDIMDFLTSPDWNNDPRGTDDRSLAILMNTNTNESPKTEIEPLNLEPENDITESTVNAEEKCFADTYPIAKSAYKSNVFFVSIMILLFTVMCGTFSYLKYLDTLKIESQSELIESLEKYNKLLEEYKKGKNLLYFDKNI